MKQYLRHLLISVILLLSMSPVFACTFNAAPVSADLGSPSSFLVATTPQKIASATGFKCPGSILAIIATSTIKATISSSAHPAGTTAQLYSSSAQQYIPYIMCQNSDCNTQYPVGSTIIWQDTSLIGLLGLFNASDGSLPIYFQTTAKNVPAGIYTDTITIDWDYNLCNIGTEILGIKLCLYSSGTGKTSINLRLNIQKDCKINNAPDINFNKAALPSQFQAVNSTIDLQCSNKADYTVTMISANPVIGNWRQMSALVNGTTYNLQYQLLDPVNKVWDPLTGYPGTGTGDNQSMNYTARVNPDQPNLPAGNYKDTVTVTVSY